jgi:hypothetical protein
MTGPSSTPIAAGSESRKIPVNKSDASNLRSMICTTGATERSFSCQAKSPQSSQPNKTASPPAV